MFARKRSSNRDIFECSVYIIYYYNSLSAIRYHSGAMSCSREAEGASAPGVIVIRNVFHRIIRY